MRGSDASPCPAKPAVGYAADRWYAPRHRDVLRSHRGARTPCTCYAALINAEEGPRWCAKALVDEYLRRRRRPHRQPHARHKGGGLANEVEKALGSIAKAGNMALMAVAGHASAYRQGTRLRRYARQRFHLRHPATGLHEPARLHHWRRHALRTGDGAGGEGFLAHGAGRTLAGPDRYRRRPHRHRRRHHRGRRLGDLPLHPRRSRRPPAHLGRTLGVSPTRCAVQSRPGYVRPPAAPPSGRARAHKPAGCAPRRLRWWPRSIRDAHGHASCQTVSPHQQVRRAGSANHRAGFVRVAEGHQHLVQGDWLRISQPAARDPRRGAARSGSCARSDRRGRRVPASAARPTPSTRGRAAKARV